MSKENSRPQVQPVHLGIIIVIAVLLIGFYGFRTLKGESVPVGPTYRELNEQALDLAYKYKGDATKLTPDELKIVKGASWNMPEKFMQTGYPLRAKQISEGKVPAPK